MAYSAKNSTQTALVAGGAGFVGSHLCEALLSQGISVVCIDNSPGSKKNVEHLLHDPNFRFIEHDINKPFSHDQFLKISWIFALSGTNQSDSKEANVEKLLTNSIGTYNLLELARTHSARFILLSSANLANSFGQTSQLAGYFGETGNAFYSTAEANKFAEELVSQYLKKYDLNAVVLRVEDIYGPRMHLKSGGSLNKIINQTIKGNKIILDGDGLDLIHPTYIQDVIFGILKASHNEEAKGKIFYLISPKSYTSLGVAQLIKDHSNPNLDIETKKNLTPLEPPFSKFDLHDSLHILAWQPRVDLAEGLKTTLNSFTPKVVEVQPQPVEVKEEKTQVKQSVEPVETTDVIFSPKHREDNDLWGTSQIKENLSRSTVSLTEHIKGIKMPRVQKAHLKDVIVASSLALVVLSVFSPVASLFIHTALGFSELEGAKANFDKGSYQRAADQAASAANHLDLSHSEVANVSWLVSLFRQKQNLDNAKIALGAASNLSSGLRETSLVLGSIKTIFDSRESLAPSEVSSLVSDANNSLSLAQKELVRFQSEWGRVDTKSTFPFLLPANLAKVNQVGDINQVSTQLGDNYPFLVSLLGLGGENNLGLVFMEDEAVKSAFVLKGQDARLESTALTLDEDLKTKIAEEAKLSGANTVQAILENNSKKDISATLIFDRHSLEALSNILDPKGSVSDSVENLSERLVKQLLEADYAQLSLLAGSLQSLSEEKHILASTDTIKLTSIPTQRVLGASSVVPDGNSDFLYFSLDSTSGSKPEVYFRYDINVADNGEFHNELTLNLRTPGEWEGAVGVTLPKGSTLVEAISGETKLRTKKSESATTIVFKFPLKINKEGQVRLKLDLPYKISTVRPTSYSLVIPKQVGTDRLEGVIFITTPPGLQLLSGESTFTVLSQPYKLNVSTPKDFKFNGKFLKD